MFGRFTDRARRAVVLAQEEARHLRHNYMGTEHILLGLIHEDEGIAAQALKEQGVTIEGARRRVIDTIGVGTIAPAGHLPFTPHGRMTLEHSSRESLKLGHNYIGPEHILLGLLTVDTQCGAGRVLSDLLVDLAKLRGHVINTVLFLSANRETAAQNELDTQAQQRAAALVAAERRARAWEQYMLNNDPPVVAP